MNRFFVFLLFLLIAGCSSSSKGGLSDDQKEVEWWKGDQIYLTRSSDSGGEKPIVFVVATSSTRLVDYARMLYREWSEKCEKSLGYLFKPGSILEVLKKNKETPTEIEENIRDWKLRRDAKGEGIKTLKGVRVRDLATEFLRVLKEKPSAILKETSYETEKKMDAEVRKILEEKEKELFERAYYTFKEKLLPVQR